MSEKLDNGGPAFPCDDKGYQGECPRCKYDLTVPPDWQGMTLRDYFAGLAMRDILERPSSATTPDHRIARWAYQLADAMLAARKPTEAEGEYGVLAHEVAETDAPPPRPEPRPKK